MKIAEDAAFLEPDCLYRNAAMPPPIAPKTMTGLLSNPVLPTMLEI